MSASQPTPSEGPLTGDFRDGPFVGLGYRTSTHEGVTDETGRFFYQAGETVTFFIDNLVIGTAAAAAHLTLASLHDSAATGIQIPRSREQSIVRASCRAWGGRQTYAAA